MTLDMLRKQHRVLDLFVELAEIPSPSKKEQELAKRIMDIFNIHGIRAVNDSYGNIIAKIPATPNCKKIPPILLSAHMDVVGDSSPINIRISDNKKYIETDKKRTLGADNKVGVAAILDLAIQLNDIGSKLEHGPVEITFTRDEEHGMSGIRELDTSLLQSKYAIIADGDYLGELDTEGASFTNIYIKIHNAKGGHSGLNIADTTRLNAIKILSELDSRIPQGVYKSDSEKGVITSINAGTSASGTVGIFISEAIKEVYKLARENKPIPAKYSSSKIFDTISHESLLNIINTDAVQVYSIRSSDPENESELIKLIREQVIGLNNKYSGLLKIDMDVKIHLKPFVKNGNTFLSDLIIEAAQKNDINAKPGAFHAGAETHVLANEKVNANGESFIPVILGLADLKDIHSCNERVDWNSFIIGRKWLEDIIVTFAQKHKENGQH